MNVSELETLDKNAGVLFPRLLKKARVVTDKETGEIIRDKRGVVFLSFGLPALLDRLERQCERESGGHSRVVCPNQQEEIARAQPAFGSMLPKPAAQGTAFPTYGKTPCIY